MTFFEMHIGRDATCRKCGGTYEASEAQTRKLDFICKSCRAERDRAYREQRKAQVISAELLEALDWYADQLCEGWCEKSPDCAHFDDCAGCLARRTAWKARGGA